jgi:micrococcal nuclease
MYEYRATIVRVVDGDTVDASVDLGFDVRFTMRLRLFGINAPEMKTPAGPPAKDHLIALLHPDAGTTPPAVVAAMPVVVLLRTQKDHQEKYGRYLATLFLPGSLENSLNDQMVSQGFAVAYLP